MNTIIKEVAKEVTMKKKLGEAISFLLNDYIKRKVAEYRKNIKSYERKYGMSYEEFEKRLGDRNFLSKLEKQIGTIQVEDDYFDWGGFVSELRYLEKRLSELSSEVR